MVAAARMPAMGIEACEDDTRLHFDVESDLPRFLDSVLQRTDQISQTKVDEENWALVLTLFVIKLAGTTLKRPKMLRKHHKFRLGHKVKITKF